MNKIKALIWKEWREQRLTITLMVLFMLSWYIVSAIVCHSSQYLVETITKGSIAVLPLIIAAVLGVLSFAEEKVHDRWMFLSSRALAAGKVFCIKYLFGLLLSLLLCFISWLAAFIAIYKGYMQTDWSFLNIRWIIGYFFILALVYSSTMMSIMLTGRAMLSLILSPFIIVLTVILTIPALIAAIPFMPSWESLFSVYILMLVSLLTVANAAFWHSEISKGFIDSLNH